MPKSHRAYPPAFRRQMIELVQRGRNWVKQAALDAGLRTDGLTTEEHEELRRLRRENRQLREERAILSKAAAWFARETNAIPSKDSSS
jgi:transposase